MTFPRENDWSLDSSYPYVNEMVKFEERKDDNFYRMAVELNEKVKAIETTIQWQESSIPDWEIEDGVARRIQFTPDMVYRDFFDWSRIPLVMRKVVAEKFASIMPNYEISSDPTTLEAYFAGQEFFRLIFDAFGEDMYSTSRDLIRTIWPGLRNTLIEFYPEIADDLACAIYNETRYDWKPVGDREATDAIVFLKRLQAGRASVRHGAFALYRLQFVD